MLQYRFAHRNNARVAHNRKTHFMLDNELSDLLKRALRHYLPKDIALCRDVLAYRFEAGTLKALRPDFSVQLDDLLGVDTQKNKLIQNTRQFLQGYPANHVLLTGARGAGKSSLVRAILGRYHPEGLRLIEMNKENLAHLDRVSDAIDALGDTNLRYIVYCDDLSFSAHDENYRALKSVLDGSVQKPKNLLIYATSNRRYLLPQSRQDNLDRYHGDDVNPRENTDENVSLSDRFGLWLSFHPIDQNQYLAIARHYLEAAGFRWNEAAKEEALIFAALRSTRSGRLAYQFSQDFIGKTRLQNANQNAKPNHQGKP